MSESPDPPTPHRRSPRIIAQQQARRLSVPPPTFPGPEISYVRRTVTQIVASRSRSLPAGFPSGPWASKQSAVDVIGTHCIGLHAVGKGHGISVKSSRKETYCAGPKTLIKCERNPKEKAAGGTQRGKASCGTGCGWQVWIEESDEGWMPLEVKGHDDENEHNHPLTSSIAEQLVNPRQREIPEYLLEFGIMLRRAGQGPAAIHRFMTSVALEDNVAVT